MYISDWKVWQNQVNQSLKPEHNMFGKGQTMFKRQSKIQADNDRAKADYSFQSKNGIPHADRSSIKKTKKTKVVTTGYKTNRATPKKRTVLRKPKSQRKGLNKKAKHTKLGKGVSNKNSKRKAFIKVNVFSQLKSSKEK